MAEDQLRDHGTRLARVEQRVEDLATSVRAMAPLITQHAQMDIRFGHMEEELHGCRQDIAKVRKTFEERAEQERKDREQASQRAESDRKTRRNIYIAAGLALAAQFVIAVLQISAGAA